MNVFRNSQLILFHFMLMLSRIFRSKPAFGGRFCLLVLILFLSSCISGDDPTPWSECTSRKCFPSNTIQDVPAQIATKNELVVYLDTSASMAGYISPNEKNVRFSVAPDGQTIFSKTLLGIREVINTLPEQPAIIVKHVSNETRLPDNNQSGLSYAATTRSLYIGGETNLISAIGSFSKPLEENDKKQDAAPPRFHILVTDGVQSTDQQQTGRDCTKGSDASCLKGEIQTLIRKGWNAIILGLRSEFDGFVYSENAPRDLPSEKRRIYYPSGNDNPEKFRPFYLYIFSPDKSGLEKLVEMLKQGLHSRSNKIVLREYVLTDSYINGTARIQDIDLSPDAKNYLFVQDEITKEGEEPRLTVRASLDTAQIEDGKENSKRFVINIKPTWSNHAVDSNLNELGAMLKWELFNCSQKDEKAEYRYPNLKIIKEEIEVLNDGSVMVPLEASWTAGEAGTRKWRMFRLVGRLDTEKNAPSWVAQWSAEDDQKVEAANKTLNLSISLANLWNNYSLKNHNIAEVCLRVGEN